MGLTVDEMWRVQPVLLCKRGVVSVL